jgi:hypothetical protein
MPFFPVVLPQKTLAIQKTYHNNDLSGFFAPENGFRHSDSMGQNPRFRKGIASRRFLKHAFSALLPPRRSANDLDCTIAHIEGFDATPPHLASVSAVTRLSGAAPAKCLGLMPGSEMFC